MSVDARAPASWTTCRYFCLKDLLTLIICGVTSWRQTKWSLLILTYFMPRKSRFFDLVTNDLEYQTRPRYCPDTSLHRIRCPYVKHFGHESVTRQTDRWTDGRTRPETLPRPLMQEEINMCILPGQNDLISHLNNSTYWKSIDLRITFDDLRMNSSDAVDSMWSDNSKVGHVNLLLSSLLH